MMNEIKRPLVLMILDGFGLRAEQDGNAVFAANTPNIDRYLNRMTVQQLRLILAFVRSFMANSPQEQEATN